MTKATAYSGAPEDIALSVIEEIGHEIVATPEADGVLGFAMPNSFGTTCSACVEHVATLGVMRLSVQLVAARFPSFLYDGVLQIINGLQLQIPAVQFTFSPRDDDVVDDYDEIEVHITHLLDSDGEVSADSFENMVHFMERVVPIVQPVFATYVAQKLVYSIRADGVVTGVRERTGTEECMQLIREGVYGRA
jgi:hypothetical protein